MPYRLAFARLARPLPARGLVLRRNRFDPASTRVARLRERSGAGFTLLEMLIVIVVFAMLTLLSFPTLSRLYSHSRVNQAAVVVAHDLSQAVSDAARARKPVRIARGADLKSITVTDRQSGTLLQTVWLGPDSYQLDSIAFSVSPVDLFPNGFTSNALTVTLWARGYSRQVTLSRAGWVRAP